MIDATQSRRPTVPSAPLRAGACESIRGAARETIIVRHGRRVAAILLVGLATVIRSRFVERVHLDLNLKNIAIILTSLCGLAVISTYVNMIAGIVFIVFCSTLAGTSYSWVRNVKIAASLVTMALVLQKLLGLNLPLY